MNKTAFFGASDSLAFPGWDSDLVPLYDSDVEQLHENSYGHILVHHTFTRIDALKSATDYFSIPLTGYTENLTPHIGHLFKSQGIARVLSTEQLIRYGRKVLEIPAEAENCRVLLCDTDEVMISMIRTICGWFGCEFECVDDQNTALSVLDESHDLFLLNIDQKSFECTRFVHKASSIRTMLKSLFVPYMSTGMIHVSDILSGLGRFSRVILSADELCSFLVTVFHNKGIRRTIGLLMEKTADFCTDKPEVSIRQMYTELGDDIFTLDCACNEKVEYTWERLEALRSVIARVVPFKWLVLRHQNEELTPGKNSFDKEIKFPFT